MIETNPVIKAVRPERKHMTTDTHVVDSLSATGLSSRKWPVSDHRLVLKRSTSADSVLMADAYQVIGGSLSAHTYGLRSDQCTQRCQPKNYPIALSSLQAIQRLGSKRICHLISYITVSLQTPQEWEESDKIRFESTLKQHKTESVQNTALQRRSDTRFVSNKDQSTQSIGRFTWVGTGVQTAFICSDTLIDNNYNSLECDSYKATQVLVTSGVSPTKSATKSGPITIPTKLCVENSRSANSLEELNQEIENLVLKGMNGYDNQTLCDKVPEGHRAPVFELLAIKAQKQISCVGSSGEDSSDLSQSESPIFATEIISTTTTSDTVNDIQHNYSMSPKINKFLTREPPDGCEKIKIVNEDDRMNAMNYHSDVSLGGFVCPVQPSSGFVLLPSRSSAFLPIFKPNDFSADYLKNRINYRKS
ncbi:unnamed protein product [Medioppia subpectinata]|uniref:Uncharacterized protein n=1 Tax=Medioppia subpectinata TaxID=1979941 RepID=A0A7R9PTZ7_9ACAR|nr:unnamed protein product [Medioppia subpectinata]CAG2100237.1 unnamed protein product [Medioppia subpectinata]